MIESLIIAGFSVLVVGALMMGGLRVEVKSNTRAIKAMHARLDALMLALAKRGTIHHAAVAHLARATPRPQAVSEGEPHEA